MLGFLGLSSGVVAGFFTNEYKSTTLSSILLLILAVVLIVVYFTMPSIFNKINLQGGDLLVNQPVSTDSLYSLGTYQDLNGKDSFDYQYAISSWIFLESAAPNMNPSYDKYTSLLNFGEKPNIMYNGKTNTLMITMQQKGLAHTTGNKLIDGIGATELLHIFISASDHEIIPGLTGKPVPGYQAMVVDQDFKEVRDGEQGFLAVKGPTGCRYLNDSRQKDYVVNGWNLTGDIYTRTSEGYFKYESRADDMIISSGYNIAAPEVENALLMHKGVAEVAVVGLPDDERGMVVTAYIVLRAEFLASDAMAKELQDHVKNQISPYKYPRSIHFVDSLPKTTTGKLQRFRLKN
jgi:acyl-CoA synthetase (AMP-forming)/AMP-acid ligase II